MEKLQHFLARLTDRQRQWLWFAGLWLAGLAAVTILGQIIRFIMFFQL